jgi:hypothetical protein
MLKRLLFGIGFVLIYLVASVIAAGAGHGTYIFFAVSMPYGFGLLVYPILWIMTAYLESAFFRLAYLSVIAVHYVTASIFVYIWWNDDYPYLKKTWEINPVYVLLPLTVLMIGHFLLWRALFQSLGRPNIELR